ncbi:MAG: hypothetical protein ACKVOM_03490 [Ferruginibacter sp.]
MLHNKLIYRIFSSLIVQIELEQKPSKQIDTEAQSTEKHGKKYIGYKGYIGVDVESKIIRKRTFTPANVLDSQEMGNVLNGDEKSIWIDKVQVWQVVSCSVAKWNEE